MQNYNTDNQLTFPPFADYSVNTNSENQQTNPQVALRSENVEKPPSSQKDDGFHPPRAEEDDGSQARDTVVTDIVGNENQVLVDKPLLKAPTICNIPESKVKCFFVPLILLFIVAELVLMISFRHYRNTKAETNFRSVTADLSFIGSNLAAHPILDMQLLQGGSKTSCPRGYQDLVLATWPGTVRGCGCQDGLKFGVCRNSGVSPCYNYSPRGPIDISRWGSSKWCILRAQPESQYTKSSECGAGFRKCSLGICVLETLDCPITNLQLNNESIVKERTKGELPIIGVDITFSDVPYLWLKPKKKENLESGLDEKYRFVFDDQKQKEVFDQNNFPQEVLSLPGYANVCEKTEAVLSFRKRLKMVEKDICLNIDTEKLEKSSNAIEDLQKILEGSPIVTEVFHWIQIGLIILMILLLRPLHTSWGFLLKGEGSGYWMLWAVGMGITELTILGLTFIIIVSDKAEMVKTQEYLTKLVEMGCFVDQEAQNAAIGFGTVVNEETRIPLKYSLLILLIAIFSCVLSSCISFNVARKATHAYRRRETWNNANSRGRRCFYEGLTEEELQ